MSLSTRAYTKGRNTNKAFRVFPGEVRASNACTYDDAWVDDRENNNDDGSDETMNLLATKAHTACLGDYLPQAAWAPKA